MSLAGENFSSAATVSFDGVPATGVLVQSGTLLTAQLPARPGKWDKATVVVENADGQRASRDDLFTYHAIQPAFSQVPLIPFENFGPALVTAGDFNGDTKPDLVVSASPGKTRNDMVLLLGDGKGGVASTHTFSVALAPSAVVSGDWNGDQKLDLATVSQRDNQARVFLGNGAGAFALATTVPIGSKPSALQAADVNADQKLDLVVASAATNRLGVLFGDGTGALSTAREFDVGSPQDSIAVGDWNDDRNLDLLTTSTSGAVSLLFGNGRGDFVANPPVMPAPSPTAMAVGDFNGDKRPDLAVFQNTAASSVEVFLGNSLGGFDGSRRYSIREGSVTTSLLLRDFNNDQKLDIAVLSQFGVVNLLLGDGTGHFIATADLVVGGDALLAGSALVDFNGDQKPDLVVPHGSPTFYTQSSVGLFWGDGTGKFQSYYQYSEGGGMVEVGDLNSDGKSDLVLLDGSANYARVLLSDGSGRFSQPARFPIGVQAGSVLKPAALRLADLNGDKKNDLVVANPGVGIVSVLFGNGAGGFEPFLELAVSANQIAIGDIDGDTKLDLVAASGSLVSIYKGNGAGAFTLFNTINVAATVRAITVADLNQDSITDFAVLMNGSSSLGLFMADGKGIFHPRAHAAGNFAAALEAIDMNGDQLVDLLISDGIGAKTVFLNQRSGEFSLNTKYSMDSLSLAADLNGDQKPDAAHMGEIRLNEAAGLGLAAKSFPAVHGVLVAGDFNGDGKTDLATVNGSVTVSLNQSR